MEIFVRETFGRGIAQSGKCPSRKCKSGVCPRSSVSRETLLQSVNFKNTLDNFLRKYFSVIVLLVKGFAQGTIRKELFIGPLVECFKTDNLRRFTGKL